MSTEHGQLASVMKEAVNLGRTQSFPVFDSKGTVAGRVYYVPQDMVEWLSRETLNVDNDYVVLVKGDADLGLVTYEANATGTGYKGNMYYSGFEGDFDDAEERDGMAGQFSRVFGYMDGVRAMQHTKD